MWANQLLPASYRGIVFNCLSIEDNFEKSLVEHAYPYVAGADIEDMGRGPRQISVQAFFYGDVYEAELEAFVVALDVPGVGEFMHPVLGPIPNAQVVRGSVHHEADAIDQATLSFELVESTAGGPFFYQQTTLQMAEAINQAAQAARTQSGSLLSRLFARLQALNPMSQLTALRQAILGPLFQLKAMAGAVLTSGMDVINFPLSVMSDVTALSAGVMNVGHFSVSTLFADYRNAFNRLSQVLTTGSTVVVLYPATTPVSASAVAASVLRVNPDTPTQAGTIQSFQIHLQVELSASIADAAAAVFASEAITPTLSPVDIEAMTNSSRVLIESTIELVTAAYPLLVARPIIEALKDLALAVQTAAQAIIVASPPLIARPVLTPLPLRVLAFMWYGDHGRAIELQRLNSLANPNFLSGSEVLTAYAR